MLRGPSFTTSVPVDRDGNRSRPDEEKPTMTNSIGMYDAVIVGARCAGSPTAMLLARKGYRVLVVDRATFPSDTLSTHLVQPPAWRPCRDGACSIALPRRAVRQSMPMPSILVRSP
jgi:hypothetical protein